ncbi:MULTISPECIES: hypothetical protein [unclassified Sporosarcina]|uniref:hypothetical protein n=1 Tax=unclassified Sporosarcina TaxID=2647733 RepID=UPI00203AC203|nr:MULTISPECIES: hypothetical protein [unclassified Sporosarcina]GKV65209.1 hypothetical protein NCCP2331_13620 [Sporosarcina sp. NCCP-2331]GLB55333.1 hypothetical protein NCCP2378_11190 [Sporosarcina sp. NCCP-2378]
MNITVGELFEFAVEMDMSLVSHNIYWALANKKIGVNDSVEKLKKVNSDEAAVLHLHKTNLLGIGRIKLYAIKTQTKDWFAFYFAEHSLDVFRLHGNKFGENDVSILNADRLATKVMASAESGREEFLFERKKRIAEFPAYIGHAKAGETVMYQM